MNDQGQNMEVAYYNIMMIYNMIIIIAMIV